MSSLARLARTHTLVDESHKHVERRHIKNVTAFAFVMRSDASLSDTIKVSSRNAIIYGVTPTPRGGRAGGDRGRAARARADFSESVRRRTGRRAARSQRGVGTCTAVLRIDRRAAAVAFIRASAVLRPNRRRRARRTTYVHHVCRARAAHVTDGPPTNSPATRNQPYAACRLLARARVT